MSLREFGVVYFATVLMITIAWLGFLVVAVVRAGRGVVRMYRCAGAAA